MSEQAAVLALQARAYLLSAIRAFFAERNVLEVETPLISQAAVCEPHLQNLSTQINQRRYYLQTSPESAMKRLLALGSGCIFQISKAFRDDQSTRLHRPEFTLLEWYRVGLDYQQLMDEVEQLIGSLLPHVSFRRISYQALFIQELQLDPFSASLDQLAQCAGPVEGQLNRNELLDLILIKRLLVDRNGGLFIYDYPSDQAAMAKIRGSVAERFELLIDGIELANGYTELTDPQEQRRRFEQDNQQRLTMAKQTMPIDEKLLAALDSGLPDCAGVAVGLDRLLMCLMQKNSLQEVLAFPEEVE